MTDRELFEEVLNRFQKQYRFEIEHPYGDAYFELKKNEEVIGGMNPEGYNLLYNLFKLCKLLQRELG